LTFRSLFALVTSLCVDFLLSVVAKLLES